MRLLQFQLQFINGSCYLQYLKLKIRKNRKKGIESGSGLQKTTSFY